MNSVAGQLTSPLFRYVFHSGYVFFCQQAWPKNGSTKRTMSGIVLFKLNIICFHVWERSLVLILRVFCVRRVYRGSIFFSLVLILRICAYLGIKGDQFFSDLGFFWRSIYVQIDVLQFVSPVQFYAKSFNFYMKLNVSNLYITNLY
jgi:hypothetical protein